MASHSVTSHPTQVNAPRLTPAMQAGTQFTYPGGMEGWVDLVDLIAPRPGVEPATFRSWVRHRTTASPRQDVPNDVTTKPNRHLTYRLHSNGIFDLLKPNCNWFLDLTVLYIPFANLKPVLRNYRNLLGGDGFANESRNCAVVEQSFIARHCCAPSPSSTVSVFNHISSHFLILLSHSSLICTVPMRWSSFWTL